MGLFQLIAALVSMTAIAAYINHRFIHLHPSIGIMLVALVFSLVLVGLEHAGIPIRHLAETFLSRIHFNDAVLQWMLGFLLFAGAIEVDLNELARYRGVTAVLTIAGTVASMFIIGGLTWALLRVFNGPLRFSECLLFGALISPTDPVAVIGVMKSAGASKAIQTVISAESLFNDGIGVVLFLTLLEITHGAEPITFRYVSWLFVREALGGALLGLGTGALVYLLLRNVYNYQVEILLTLALVMSTYAIANRLHMSAPIAAVAAGLLIGNQGRIFNMSGAIRGDLERFWELIDEILNAVLFFLIGLQALLTPFTARVVLITILAIPMVLLARWLSVLGTICSLPVGRRSLGSLLPILTWGGLRGGLAVAMALSIPPGLHRDTLVAMTYGIVVFSIIVQGTTIQRVVKWSLARD